MPPNNLHENLRIYVAEDDEAEMVLLIQQPGNSLVSKKQEDLLI